MPSGMVVRDRWHILTLYWNQSCNEVRFALRQCFLFASMCNVYVTACFQAVPAIADYLKPSVFLSRLSNRLSPCFAYVLRLCSVTV